MYKEDLALNNLQWLICHKTQPNQTKQNQIVDNAQNTFSFPLNGFSISEKIEKIKIEQYFVSFLHTLLKPEIIWTRISQVIRLRNYFIFLKTQNISTDIDFS